MVLTRLKVRCFSNFNFRDSLHKQNVFCWVLENFLLFDKLLKALLQKEIMQKLSSVQKLTSITTIAD